MTKFNPGSSLLLKAVVGSQAFGLANEDSDYDYQGIFVVPTTELLSLSPNYQESMKFNNPDTTYHEVGKFCKLALGCNPTVLDLLWVDEYNVRTQLGTDLINLRSNFLSAPRVRGAYFGYANDQFDKLLKDEREHKRAKNARHFLRLLEQGSELYLTGTYFIKLADPAKITSDALRIARGDLNLAEKALLEAEKKFAKTSVLPEKANRDPVNEWLLEVRHAFYTQSSYVQQGYSNRNFAGAMEELKRWP
jgi:predicted nucleotidyltransferase